MFDLHSQYCLFKQINTSKSIDFNHDWHFACFLSWQVFISDSGKKEDIAKANLICQSMGGRAQFQSVCFFTRNFFFFFCFFILKKQQKLLFCFLLKPPKNLKFKTKNNCFWLTIWNWSDQEEKPFVTDLICLVILVTTTKNFKPFNKRKFYKYFLRKTIIRPVF